MREGKNMRNLSKVTIVFYLSKGKIFLMFIKYWKQQGKFVSRF